MLSSLAKVVIDVTNARDRDFGHWSETNDRSSVSRTETFCKWLSEAKPVPKSSWKVQRTRSAPPWFFQNFSRSVKSM